MNGKINRNDILRLAYESYKRKLKEEADNEAKTLTKPIDYHVSVHNGKYYFNITLSDKNLYDNVGDLKTSLIKKLIFKNDGDVLKGLFEKYGNKLLASNEYKALYGKYSRYFNLYPIFDKNENKDTNNPDALIFNTPIYHPEELYDENGNVNTNSKDFIRIRGLLNGFGQSVGVKPSETDIETAVKSAFYGVKNMACDKKAIEDSTKELFFEVCKSLGKEDTQKLLRTIQVGTEGYVFDSQLSFLNRLRVISQAMNYGSGQVNTISYLLTERQWRKSGRQVVDYSHPYRIVVAHKGREGREHDWSKVYKQGYVGLDESFTADKHANKLANYDSDRNGFGYHVVYDVQATQPMQGHNDEVMNEPAMKNNITGELNDIAKSRITQKQGELEPNNNRTEKLNDLFNTTDYDGVNTIYQAVCMTNGSKPNLPPNTDVKSTIRETGKIIDEMLIKKLTSFKKGGGHIAQDKNYRPLIPIGRIIIQAIIGLPMDSAPAVEWVEEHKTIAAALSSVVNAISNSIIENKKEILGLKKQNVNEMVKLYSPLFVFEETFNNILNLIEENVQCI